MPPRPKGNMPMALPPGRPPDERFRAPRSSTRLSTRPIGYRHTSNVPLKNDRVWAEEKPRQLLLKGKTAVTKTTKMGNQRAPPDSNSTTHRNGTAENMTYPSRKSERRPLRTLRSGYGSSYTTTTRRKEIREHATDMRPSNRPARRKERDLNPRTNKYRTKNSRNPSRKSKQESKINEFRETESKSRDDKEKSTKVRETKRKEIYRPRMETIIESSEESETVSTTDKEEVNKTIGERYAEHLNFFLEGHDGGRWRIFQRSESIRLPPWRMKKNKRGTPSKSPIQTPQQTKTKKREERKTQLQTFRRDR